MARTERTAALREEPGIRAAYAAHGGELYGFAVRSLGDAGLAEEAVQETFLRAWRHSDRFDPEVASLRTWLFAICRHVVIDLARRRAVRPPVVDIAAADGADPTTADEVDRALTAWQVEEALRRIGEDHRRVLTEVYYRARPYAEVAGELGVPVGTVKSRVYYGLRALRLALEEMGVEG
ncbi:MAG TPA: sigma-70 family RNA polymerase sigma factor [Actinomycetota bacterium]